jgi:hypothetical protein
MFNISQFRQQNPQFAEMDSYDLAHKVYSANPALQNAGVTFNDFAKQSGADEDYSSRNSGFVDTVKAIGAGSKTLWSQVKGSTASAIRGGDIDTQEGYADKVIRENQEIIQAYLAEYGKNKGDSFLNITPSDVATAISNMGFSGVAAVTGLAVGGATAALPVPGARPAAYATGSAAMGKVAYNMARDQFTQTFMDAVNEDRASRGTPSLTEEEWQPMKEGLDQKAHEYGLWEAIPEAIGGAVGFKIITAPLKGFLKKYLKDDIGNRMLGKLVSGGARLGATTAEQLVEETITQYGQGGIEADVGLRDERPTWKEAGKEIYGPTVALTAIMAGGAKGAHMGYEALTKKKAITTNEPTDLLKDAPIPEADPGPVQDRVHAPGDISGPTPMQVQNQEEINQAMPVHRSSDLLKTHEEEVSEKQEAELESLQQSMDDERQAQEWEAEITGQQQAEAQRQEELRREEIQRPYPDTNVSGQIPDKGLAHIVSSEVNGQKIKVNVTPTEAQKQAGNYLKGAINIQGMEISIENPKGSERTGVDENGKDWSVTMNHPYGYFNRTEGKDGEQIDVIVGPNPESEKAFVVDQINPNTGNFDEHKSLVGFKDKNSAREGYLSNYEEGWKGLGEITETPVDEFKAWIGDGKRKTLPYADHIAKKDEPAVKVGDIIHTMPDGSIMPGPEHKGSVPGSERKATQEDINALFELGEPKKPKKTQGAIQRKLTDSEIVKTEDVDAVEKLKKKIDKLVKIQDLMNAADKIVNKKNLSYDEKVAELLEIKDRIQSIEKQRTEKQVETKKPSKDVKKPEKLTKKQKALQEYQNYIGALSPEQTELAGDLVQEDPKYPSGQVLKIKKRLKDAKKPIPKIKPLKQSTKGANVRTIRGYINTVLSGINPGNMKGEVEELPVAAKFLFRKSGTPLDLAEEDLKANGWMHPDEDLLSELRDPEFLKRRPITKELEDIPEAELTKAEKEVRDIGKQDIEAGETAEFFEKKGFEMVGGKDITVADLNEGDKVFAEIDGVKDEYTVNGLNKEGEVIFQNGVQKEIDVFDKINIEAIKRVEEPKERDSFTVERYDKEADDIVDLGFNRGEYVKAFINKEKWSRGEIQGISHANKQAKVNNLWFGFGSIYKAKKPAEIKKKKVPLSEAITAAEKAPPGGFKEGDKVPKEQKPLLPPEKPTLLEKQVKEVPKPKRERKAKGVSAIEDQLLPGMGMNQRGLFDKKKPKEPVKKAPAVEEKETPFGESSKEVVVSPFEQAVDRVNKKYAKIISLPEVTTKSDFYSKIDEFEVTPKMLDTYLKESDNPVKEAKNIQSILADRVGELIETHRYESEKEGEQFEKELDGLLSIANGYISEKKVRVKTVQADTKKKPTKAKGLPTDRRVEKEGGSTEQYSTRKGDAADLSLSDIRSAFKGQEVGLGKDGNVWVITKSGHRLTIKNVESISDNEAAYSIGYGKALGGDIKPNISGSYQAGVIKIVRSIGDKFTLSHESVHWMEDVGILNKMDRNVLDNAVKKAGFGKGLSEQEARAQFIEQELINRDKYRKTPLGRVLQKIQDFIDGFINLVKKTSKGLVREIESGKVYDRKVGDRTYKTTVPAYSKTAGRWYSQMERFLSEKLPGKATPVILKGMLSNWAKKGEIKAEELEWSGVLEWLDQQEGKVTKQQVLDFLKENNVEVQEVVKGDIKPLEWKDAVKGGKFTVSSNPDLKIEHLPNGMFTLHTPGGTRDLHKTIDAAKQAGERVNKNIAEPETKFSQYQLPGGKNYKELILTLRGADLGYVTPQFHQYGDAADKNRLAWVRFNERTDSEGNKVLFIEEIQSDWHQEGRKKGYGETDTTGWKVLQDESVEGKWDVFDKDGRVVYSASGLGKEETLRLGKASALQPGVPDAPFKKTWPIMTMKRMVRHATENGFDKIAWTTGEMQADRYDLSKQVTKIETFGRTDAKTGEKTKTVEILPVGRVLPITLGVDNNGVIDNSPEVTAYLGRPLEEVIGKELAEKIIKGPPYQEYSGLDLKVGGEGMKAFYDKILPSMVNKFFNKPVWGKAKVGTTGILTSDITIAETINGDYIVETKGDRYFYTGKKEQRWSSHEEDAMVFNTKPEAMAELKIVNKDIAYSATVHSLPITPEMRSKALREGMPLFSIKKPDIIQEKFGKSTKSAGEKIGGALDTIKTKDKRSDLKSSIITKVFDRLEPINKHDLSKVSYMLHRLETGFQATFAMFLEHGKLSWKEDAMTVTTKNKGVLPFLRSIGPDWEKLLYWTAAKRAEVLETEGREKWLDKTARDKIFKWTNEKHDDAYWEKQNKKLQEFNSNVLDIAQEAGLIDPLSRNAWQQDFYIPFYRIFEDEAARQEFLSAPRWSKKNITSGIKRLKGAEQTIGDPVENILHNWMHLIHESMRNKARAEAFDSAIATDNTSITPVDEVFSNKNLRKMARDKGAWKQGMKRPELIEAVFGDPDYELPNPWATQKQREADNVLTFRREGKPVYFKVNDPELFNALSNLDTSKMDNILLRMMGKSKQLLSFGATFSAGFRIANLLRDTLHTSIVSKDFTPFLDSAKGFVKSMREDQDFIEFMASGAGFGSSYVHSDDPNIGAKYIKRVLKSEMSASHILDTPKKLWDFWEKLGSASENAARVMLYKNSLERGKTNLEAAFEARDIMDFTMKGGSGTVQFLIQTIPFLNARMQGIYRLGRGFQEDRKSFTIKGLMLTAASLSLWALFKDDDRYKELEDWDKRAYYHFWIGEMHYKIPKPFETGVIFSSFPEELGNIINGTDDGKHIMDFLGYALNDVFRLEFPQAVKPIIEQWANKSFFTDRPIIGRGMEGLEPGQQYTPWTSKSLRVLGDKLNVSPKRAEALVNGYTAAFGTFVLYGADKLAYYLYDFPEDPEKSISDVEGIGRFVKEGPARHTKYATAFYETAREVDMLAKTIRHYQVTGQHLKAKSLKEKNKDLLKIRKGLNRTRKTLSKINKQIRFISVGNLSPKEKRQRIDKLTEKRNELVKRVWEVVHS